MKTLNFCNAFEMSQKSKAKWEAMSFTRLWFHARVQGLGFKGPFKGPSGAFVTNCNISCFFQELIAIEKGCKVKSQVIDIVYICTHLFIIDIIIISSSSSNSSKFSSTFRAIIFVHFNKVPK